MFEYLILAGAAFFAGLIDAIVGGGGLIQVPALLSVFPQAAPASLFGTNKFAGIWGTGVAAWNYNRVVRQRWHVILPAALAAFVAALLGAITVTVIPSTQLRKVLPLVLAVVAIYTFYKKDLGQQHAPVFAGTKEIYVAMAFAASIGFYDGFFGPGTGSFLVFVFVKFFGYDFLRASASAKLVNVACNLSALLWFGLTGHVMWMLGLAMAVCSVAGSLVGSRLAIARGSEFVRRVFLAVVVMLIAKTSWDAFGNW